MDINTIMAELEQYGSAQTKKILMKHGAVEPFFGVKVADMKKILKKTKKNHELSLELYNTGNGDAMYLAGLMADEKKIDKATLKAWAEQAEWHMISEYAVPWVAAETTYGFELGLEWIESDKEQIAACGWSALSSYASVNKDEDLDIEKYANLLNHISNHIHEAPNRVRYAMNGFVIAIGTYIVALTDKAMEVANTIGKVSVNMGGTACKVPMANDYLQKIIDKNRVGKKKKKARC